MTDKGGITPSLKWWQWALMYPTLGIALAGYMPKLVEIYDAWRHGAPIASAGESARLAADFTKNSGCLSGNLQMNSVPGSRDANILVGVCPPGTLVVLIQPLNKKQNPTFRFVSWDGSAGGNSASLFINQALAGEEQHLRRMAQAGSTIICQKPLDNGLLLIRIKDETGQCFDQTVNTYTGVVTSTVPVPCDPAC